jgi:hypothetical protein
VCGDGVESELANGTDLICKLRADSPRAARAGGAGDEQVWVIAEQRRAGLSRAPAARRPRPASRPSRPARGDMETRPTLRLRRDLVIQSKNVFRLRANALVNDAVLITIDFLYPFTPPRTEWRI